MSRSVGITIDINQEISAVLQTNFAQTLSSTLASTCNVLTLLGDVDDLTALSVAAADVYNFQLIWIPVEQANATTIQREILREDSILGIFTVQQFLNFSSQYAAVKASASLGDNLPTNFHPSLPFVSDAVRAFVSALPGASNSSDPVSIVSSLRSFDEISGGATGTIRFSSEGERVGDLLIVNHKFNATSALVAAAFHLKVNNTSPSALTLRVPLSSIQFSDRAGVVPSASHKPAFLIGLIWDTLYPDTSSWLAAARFAVDEINRLNIVPGWDFRAVFYNDGLTPAGTILGTVALSAQNVRAVVAGTTSAQATAGMYYLAPQNIPMVRKFSFLSFSRSKPTFCCRFLVPQLPILFPIS